MATVEPLAGFRCGGEGSGQLLCSNRAAKLGDPCARVAGPSWLPKVGCLPRRIDSASCEGKRFVSHLLGRCHSRSSEYCCIGGTQAPRMPSLESAQGLEAAQKPCKKTMFVASSSAADTLAMIDRMRTKYRWVHMGTSAPFFSRWQSPKLCLSPAAHRVTV